MPRWNQCVSFCSQQGSSWPEHVASHRWKTSIEVNQSIRPRSQGTARFVVLRGTLNSCFFGQTRLVTPRGTGSPLRAFLGR